MIEAHKLSKSFGKHAALKEVSLQVAKDQVLGLLGASGAGKTTFLRILAGYLPPNAGWARVAGYDVFAQPHEARRNQGYLPESAPLYQDMSVRSYLEYMGTLRGVQRPRQRVEGVVELCQLAAIMDRRICSLSRLGRKKVALAQALIHDPRVLLLDEPTGGLKPAQVIEIRDLIRRMGRERSVLLSTRQFSDTEQMCGRAAILQGGRVVVEDSPMSLRERLKGAERVRMRIAGVEPSLVIQTLTSWDSVLAARQCGDAHYEVDCAAGNDSVSTLTAYMATHGWDLFDVSSDWLDLSETYLGQEDAG